MDYQFGLIGFPVEHSLSPWIHGQLMEKSGLKGTYTPFDIAPDEDFSHRMAEMRDMHLNGFNVTLPYKEKILPHMDELDATAEAMGAVNTVVERDGEWIGYNTDGTGYLRSLMQEAGNQFLHTSRNILIIGAGGASRAIYYTLASMDHHNIHIANRTYDRARHMADNLNPEGKTLIKGLDEAQKHLEKYDLIIQTTNVGMYPDEDRQIMDVKNISNGAIVSDIIYRPLVTEFLKQAESYGAHIVQGHTMLLYQAQMAFELWTGIEVPADDVKEKLAKKLEGK